MSTTTVDGFCELLAKSDLLTKDQLADVREEVSLNDDPIAAARSLIQKELITKWQAKILLAGRCAFRLGKYILLDRISKKEAGDIYVAEHAQLGKRVAIKTLTKADTQDPDRLKAFFTHAREIAKLDHRNITHTFDIDSDGDRYFLVMEHVEGEDLMAIVEKGGPLSPVVVGNYIGQAANGLAHAHAKGILHRRIDPTNLLVDSQDTIKLLNLGISQLHLKGSNEGDGNSISSDDFTSPEITAGKNGDHRSDIYCLGCTGLFLLTGKNPSEVVRKPTTGLEKILRKMMANDPSNRIQSAESVSSLLEKWLMQHAPAALPEIVVEEPEVEPIVEEMAEAEIEEPSEVDTQEPVSDDLGLAGLAIDVGHQNGRTRSTRSTPTFSDTIEIAAGDTSKSKKSNKEQIMKPETPSVGLSSPFEKKAAPGNEAVAAPRLQASGGVSKRFSAGAIVGLAIGGSAMLVTFITIFIALIYWLVFSGNDPALAQNNVPTIAASDDDKKNGDSTTKTDDDQSDADGKDEPGDEKNTSDSEPKGDDKTPENGGETTTGDPVKKSDEPGNGDPETKPVDPPAKPDDKPEVKPMPTPPKTTPPKATPPKPAPKPMPKVTLNAFEKLPPAKNLPELGTASAPGEGYDAPLVFGDIKVDDADILLLSLEGGEEASRSTNEKFLIENARGGTAPRDFEISLQHADDSKVLIAKLWIEGDKLKFQWTPEALKEPNSNYLRNCVLSLLAGASVKDVTLREPVALGSLIPNFEKDSSISQQFEADWLPDPNKVRVEISLDKKFPPHQFDPVQELDAAGGKTKALLGQEMTLPGNTRLYPAYLQFDSKLRRNGGEIEVALWTSYFVKGKFMPGKYVEKKVEDNINGFQGENNLITGQLTRMSQNMKQIKGEGEKRAAQTQLNFLTEQQKMFNSIVGAYQGVKAYPGQIQNAKISATVFFMAGEYKVIIASN